MGQLTPLEQVQLDAQRITLKRIRDAEEEKAWQESQHRGVSLGEGPEVEEVVEVKTPKTLKTKKG